MQRPVTWRDMEEWKRKAALLDAIVELLNNNALAEASKQQKEAQKQ